MDLEAGADLGAESVCSLIVWHKVNKQLFLFSLCMFVVLGIVLHKDAFIQTCVVF